MTKPYRKTLDEFCSALDGVNRLMPQNSSIAVYANNYLWNHIHALENIFPTVSNSLSHKIFTALAKVYVENTIPKIWNINLYGSDFDLFVIAQRQSNKANVFDWVSLAALTKLEYTISKIYHAKNIQDGDTIACSVNPEKTARLSSECIRNLQYNHPYAKVSPDLCLEKLIVVSRTKLSLEVYNMTKNLLE